MDIKEIFVLGGGMMGSGIAQVCAQAGYSVTMCDFDDGALKRAINSITWSVEKLIEKGKVKDSFKEITGRIKSVTKISEAKDANFVFEAVFEKADVKRQTFKELDKVCLEDTIFATNTSAIPITEIAESTQRPDKVIGTHFFNPVPMMKAVEIVRGLYTSDETVEVATEICRVIGKEIIMVQKDMAGFLLNRINVPSILEAIRMVEQGVGSIEDIDKGMKLAFGRSMGPFETQDLTGLDVSLGAYMNIYNDTQDLKFYPPMLMRRKVKAGHLGKKTGMGWYKYDEKGNRIGPVY